jgi:hypothetical protein
MKMSRIISHTVKITTTGTAGSASGNAIVQPPNDPLEGFLLDIKLDYHASCPATADVTISDPTFGNLVVKSNNSTDVVISPRQATVDNAAAATGLYDLIPLNGPLNIAIAQADALTDCLVVTIRWLTP